MTFKPSLSIVVVVVAAICTCSIPNPARGAYVNVASQANGGVASATGTAAPAGNANDGNVNTSFNADYSAGGVQWQVVFGDTTGGNLDFVRLYPRQDCCQDRLDNYKVEFFDSAVGGSLLYSFASTTQAPLGGAMFGLADAGLTNARRMVITDMQGGTPGSIHFNFGEAQLFANVGGGPYNVALHKPTSGSTYSGSYPSHMGNDGIVAPSSNFSHGTISDSDFWEVDLLGDYDLDRLEITSRTGLPGRTNGATVTLLAPNGSLVDSFVLSGFVGGDTLQFDNGGLGWAHVARIHVEGVPYLHIAELSAIGLPAVPEPQAIFLQHSDWSRSSL